MLSWELSFSHPHSQAPSAGNTTSHRLKQNCPGLRNYEPWTSKVKDNHPEETQWAELTVLRKHWRRSRLMKDAALLCWSGWFVIYKPSQQCELPWPHFTSSDWLGQHQWCLAASESITMHGCCSRGSEYLLYSTVVKTLNLDRGREKEAGRSLFVILI